MVVMPCTLSIETIIIRWWALPTLPLVMPMPVKPKTVAPHSTRLRRKNGVLILETDSDPAIDINAWIEELREERIQEQMAL